MMDNTTPKHIDNHNKHALARRTLGNGRTYVMIAMTAGALIGSCVLSNHIDYNNAYKSTHVAQSIGDTKSRTVSTEQEVSRNSFRAPVDDDADWGGLGEMNVPYSQSSDEKTAISDLKKSIDNGNNVYQSSANKVKDDNTRKDLQSKVNDASNTFNNIQSFTKVDTSQLGNLINTINNAVQSVNDSMAQKTKEDNENAAAAAEASSSSTSTGKASAATGDIQQYALQSFSKYGWDSSQWDSLSFIVSHESSWNPNSVNSSSGARGLFQCLGHAECNSSSYINDYHVQVDWGLNYIAGRYGSPNAAAAFWRTHNWY